MTPHTPKNLRLGIIVPGLQGGVDEAARYVFESNAFERTEPTIYRTKGTSSIRAPFRFATTMIQLIVDRLQGNLDVAHVNVSADGSTLRKVIVAGLLRFLGVPYVVQVHSGRYPRFWETTSAINKIMIRPLFSRAGRTLVLGSTFVNFFTTEIGLDPQQILVVPNGVPVPTTSHKPDSASPAIVFVGRLNENKGYRTLLHALDRCSDLDWSALLMGDGETAQARTIVREYGLEQRITVKDWTDRPLVNRALDNSSILVSPSSSEALSLTLLEAMAHGLACIATPVGAHRDVLSNELNSLVVQPLEVDQLAKALRLLITNPDLRNELGSTAKRDIAQQFSIDLVCSRLEDAYHQVIRESRRNGSHQNIR